MRRGEIRYLRNDRDLVLLLSESYEAEGEARLRIAPLRPAAGTLHGDRDLFLAAGEASLPFAVFVELWNAREIASSIVGARLGVLGGEAVRWLVQVLRADALGVPPDVPVGLLGEETQDPRAGAQQLARLTDMDAAVAELEGQACAPLFRALMQNLLWRADWSVRSPFQRRGNRFLWTGREVRLPGVQCEISVHGSPDIETRGYFTVVSSEEIAGAEARAPALPEADVSLVG